MSNGLKHIPPVNTGRGRIIVAPGVTVDYQLSGVQITIEDEYFFQRVIVALNSTTNDSYESRRLLKALQVAKKRAEI